MKPISATNFTLSDDKPQAAYVQVLQKPGFGKHEANKILLITAYTVHYTADVCAHLTIIPIQQTVAVSV